jgi:hypothetical protein
MYNYSRQRIDTDRLPAAVTAKWPRPVLSEGFVPFPKRLLRCCTKIFPGEEGLEDLVVALAIVDYLRPSQTKLPSLSYLAFLAGMTPERYEVVLQRLVDRKLVRAEGQPDALDVSISGLASAIELAAAEG